MHCQGMLFCYLCDLLVFFIIPEYIVLKTVRKNIFYSYIARKPVRDMRK